MRRLFNHGEITLGCAAFGAKPVIWDLLKWRARLYAIVRIAFCRIINVAANIADIFLHYCALRFLLNIAISYWYLFMNIENIAPPCLFLNVVLIRFF